MDEMYNAIAGSPITYLVGDISAVQTTIAVADDTALPGAPNICTIGYGEHIETIRYGAKSNGVLQQVTRGLEGTPRAWQSGTEVARFYTAYDHNAIVNTITSHKAESAQLGKYGISASQSIPHNYTEFTNLYLNKVNATADFAELSNGNIKILKSGLYLVSFTVRFDAHATGWRTIIFTGAASMQVQPVTPVDGQTRMIMTSFAKYNANDIVECRVLQTSQAALNVLQAEVKIAKLG